MTNIVAKRAYSPGEEIRQSGKQLHYSRFYYNRGSTSAIIAYCKGKWPDLSNLGRILEGSVSANNEKDV